MKRYLLGLLLFASTALAGERDVTNPDLNGDLKLKINLGGTVTTPLMLQGSTGLVTIGAAGSTATHVVNGIVQSNKSSATALSGVANRNPVFVLRNTDASFVANTASSIDFQNFGGITAASITTQYSQAGGSGDGGNLIFSTDPSTGGLRQVGNVDSTGRWFLGPSGATVSHVVNGGMAVSSTDNASNQIFDVRNTGTGTTNTNIGMGIGLVGENGATGPIFIEFYDAAGAASRRGSISQSSTSVLYNTTSDGRLKTDVKDFTGALDILAKVKPRSFTWKETGKADYGFIAQELKLVYPGPVSGEADSELPSMAVDYGKLTPLLAAALKEEVAKTRTLEALVTKLEARLDAAGL